MSTILDALKKSEQERKLKNVPILNDMSAPQEQSNWQMRAIIGLLIILMLIIIWLLLDWGKGGQSVNGFDNQAAKEIVLDNNTLEAVASGETEQSNEIVVNVVSYAIEAEQRFVMINGKMYRENDFIRAGLKVETIKPDSVILNLRGRRLERKP